MQPSSAARPGTRIAIVGPQGSGKTVLAKRVSARLGLPLIGLDDHLRIGRRPRPPADQRRLLGPLLEGPDWVVEGAYWRVLDILASASTSVVFLDGPHLRSIGRLLRRELDVRWQGVSKATARELWDLGRHSLLWTALYPLVERRRALATIASARGQAPLIRARSLRQAEARLLTLSALPGDPARNRAP